MAVTICKCWTGHSKEASTVSCVLDSDNKWTPTIMKMATPLLAEVVNLPGMPFPPKGNCNIYITSSLKRKHNLEFRRHVPVTQLNFPIFRECAGRRELTRQNGDQDPALLTHQSGLFTPGCWLPISEASPMKTEQFEQVSTGKPAWRYCMKGRKGYPR